MSNQIGADEIAEFVTKAANFDTPSGVSVTVEFDDGTTMDHTWGKIEKDDDDLLVCDEDGQVVERVDTDVWTTSTLFDGIEAKDLAKIADTINSAIAAEYGAL